MIHKIIFLLLTIAFVKNGLAQQVIPLYETIPNSIAVDSIKEKTDTTANNRVRTSKVIRPAITAFIPAKGNGTAVIICPGGGYSYLVMNQEGTDVAREFNKRGVAAFVLKYRLPNDKIMPDKSIGPLQDAQQAIKTVRERAGEWNIDPQKIGIVGFSAGGHVASTASTHFNQPVIDNKEQTSLRPDFSILVYAVISFTDSLAHKGSRKALLGETPAAAAIDLYSNEKQVTASTPPAFLIHCGDDKIVPVMNSVRYYEALLQKGVKAELLIYPSGGHGFGLNNKLVRDQWLERCFNWMADNQWL